MSALAFTSPLANAPTARLYVCLFFSAVCLWRLIVNARWAWKYLESDEDPANVREKCLDRDGQPYDPFLFFGTRVTVYALSLIHISEPTRPY